MNDNKKFNHVAIIGAGFSGLSLAWAMKKNGIDVTVFEAGAHAGGLISSQMISGQLVESAANAIIADANVEQLLSDLKLNPIKAGFKSNKRYIFRSRVSRLPLNIVEILRAAGGFIFALFLGKLRPVTDETVSLWVSRIFGPQFDRYVAAPALQGIYAAPTTDLSAELVTAAIFNKKLKQKKGELRGSISFKNGMQSLIDELVKWLQINRVELKFNSFKTLSDLQAEYKVVVIATSLEQCKILLKDSDIGSELSELSTLNITSAAVQPTKPRRSRGFGCLFPSVENFKTLGVLFSSDIFENRGHPDAETWIIGNQFTDPAVLKNLIKNDRMRMENQEVDFEVIKTFVWAKALPKYDLKLKKFIENRKFIRSNENIFINGACVRVNAQNVYLTGNYLGGIGLAKILGYNMRLSERIRADLQ